MNKNESVIIGDCVLKVGMIRMVKFDYAKKSIKVFAIGLKPLKLKFSSYYNYDNCYFEIMTKLGFCNVPVFLKK